jgi:hypothetical protein
MKIQSHSLAGFIRRTDALHQRLRALIKRHPEDGLQPDDKIFNRLLTNDWRHRHNFIGPLEERYVDAAKWVGDFNAYHLELWEFCVYSLGAPTKPEELPMNPHLRLPASECLRRLDLQLEVLSRWEREAPDSGAADRFGRIRAGLQVLVKDRGMKAVAAAAGVNRDTLQDFMSGKTTPQKKTLGRLEAYAKGQKSYK